MNTNCGFLQGGDCISGLDGRTVGDFWQWGYSDILSNRNRSIFAEYMVGAALGVLDKPRVEWDTVDFRYGGTKIEVKSFAYCQSWSQNKPSPIRFSIKKALAWDPDRGAYEPSAARNADVYVFCLHAEQDKLKADVLDVDTWDFYTVPTSVLNRDFTEKKGISLSAIQPLGIRSKWRELKTAVDKIVTEIAAYPGN